MPPVSEKKKNNGLPAFLAVGAITILAFAIRRIHSQDAFGGFLSFNEAWYAIVASNYNGIASFLFPTTVYGSIDYNVSPFLSYMLYFWMIVSGMKESALTLVPVLFSALTCPVLYCLGARLFNRRAGLAAALFYASAPASVIVGRNVQAESPYIFFMLLSLLFYLKSGAGEKRRLAPAAVAGLLFGAAFFTKQFAALLLPVVVLWELAVRRGIKWFGAGQILFGAAALILPGPFYLYHLYYNRGVMLGAQAALSSEKYAVPALDVFRYMFSEYIWGVSPPLLALALAGIVYSLLKHFHSGLLILLALAGFNLFFYRWHVHSYYLLFAVPFLCLSAGALVGGARLRIVSISIAGTVSCFAALLSLAMLCSVKYGYGEFRSIGEIVDKQHVKPVVILTDSVAGSYYPVARFYGRDMDLLRESELAGLGRETVGFKDRGIFIIGFNEDGKRLPPSRVFITRNAYGLVFFGCQFVAEMESEHFFKVKKIYFMKNGRPSDFGVVMTGSYRGIILAYVPPGGKIRILKPPPDSNPSEIR